VAVFVVQNAREHSVAPLQIKSVITFQEAITGIALAHLNIKAANHLLIDMCD